jgi:histidine triad (HIT) family protein
MSVDIVFESDQVLAFHHSNPFWPTHIVVIPKAHVASLVAEDAPEGLVEETLRVVQRVARHVAVAEGEAAVMTYIGRFQHSKHLHWHVVAGDQLRPTPPRTRD